MTHNDKMEHFFAHLIPPNFGTGFFIWPTAGSTYFGYVLPKMKNNARNVMYLFVQSEGGRRDMHTSSIPNWTKLAKVRAISQVPPFVFLNVRKGSLYLPSHLSCDPDDKRVLAYFVRTNMP